MTAARWKGFQAVILAGGLGTRLRPLTETLPKSMVPVAGRPFMEYQLAYLRRLGVGEVVVCLGHLGDLIEQHFGDGRWLGVRIQYGYERGRLLGTAGAVKNVEGLLRDTFVLANGDSYFGFDLRHALRYFLSQDRLGLMVVHRNDSRLGRRNVAVEGPYVAAYDNDRSHPELRFVDCGAAIFRREAFASVPEDTPADLSVAYAALIRRRQLLKFETRERFYDIGTPQGLREFQTLVQSGVVREFLRPPRPHDRART